jgi:glycerol-3-phosphate acyltransferase PlsY
MTVIWIVLIISGYILGSVPVSLLVARARGIDLRKHGTHQVGAGNLWRMTSRKLGLTVGLFDFGKGAIMMWIASGQGLDAGQQMVVGLAAVVGHNWPIFLHFHGGRGAATSLGIVIFNPVLNNVSWWPSIIGVGAVVVLTVLIRSSAVPVLIGAASLPLTTWIFNDEVAVITAYLAMFLIIVIKRLTAQAMPEDIKIGKGQLIVNRLFFDRDIRDRTAWMRRKPIKELEKLDD